MIFVHNEIYTSIYLFEYFRFINYSSNENLDGLPKKEFVFTFSALEWQQIQPQEVKYIINDKNRSLKSCWSYYVLLKGSWTPLLSEHFWEHTNMQCCCHLI